MNGAFWKQTMERAVKTAAQMLLSLWGGGELDIVHVDLSHSASLAAGAAVLSVLMSLVSGQVGEKDNPSLV